MARIMIACVVTGKAIYTGLQAEDISAFRTVNLSRLVVRCKHCGSQHPWEPGTAFLEGDEPAVQRSRQN
jgi:hypothetical protein